MLVDRAGVRAVELRGGGGASVFQEDQGLTLSTKAAVFKRVSLLIRGAKHIDWEGQTPPWLPLAPALLVEIAAVC